MKIFSTFSGIGGFEIGIKNSTNKEVEFVGYSEIDKYAIKVYEKQFGGKCENCRLARERERNSSTSGRQETLDSERTRLPQAFGDNDNIKDERSEDNNECTCPKNYGDITKINAEELPDFDCLVGGFPCQAFSIAGKRKGFEDTRGTLFFDLARILRAKQPRLFVFENVKGLLSHDGGRTFKTIIQTIDELGYDCQWQVLNSKNYGVPQNRERVIIVGHLRGTPRPEVFPITGTDSADTFIRTIRTGGAASYTEKHARDIVQINQPTHSNDRVYTSDGISSTLNTMQGGNRQPKIVAQRGRYNADGKTEQQLYPRSDDISNTLTTVQKDNMVLDDVRIRRLTPIECERLQGFPDNWTKMGVQDGIQVEISDTQRYKMCGNAVTTNVIQAVFERILTNDQL